MSEKEDARHQATMNRWSRKLERMELDDERARKGLKQHISDALKNEDNKRNLAREALDASRGGQRFTYKGESGYNMVDNDPDVDADGNVIVNKQLWNRD